VVEHRHELSARVVGQPGIYIDIVEVEVRVRRAVDDACKQHAGDARAAGLAHGGDPFR
jgi:hypothetical protein